ncbi:small ribosomal subunit protein mS31 [Onthophagus taurus]|uniref:small ribosomal subunit protein mS31 n=1 Tax=Onthophagus taurus TaxID=166361 RepID=UPI000C209A4E|nr:28S ribosomal protein S31, mitochondrial [Onthophagus taurus]
MNKLTLLSRYPQKFCGSLSLIRTLADKKVPSSSSDSSSSDSDLNKNKSPNQAAERLNMLLKDMLNEKTIVTKKLDLAKPRMNKGKDVQNAQVKVESVEQNVAKTVKDVAESLGGDVKQTESELLAKLLSTTGKPNQFDLSETIKGMKIVTEKKPLPDVSRSSQIRGLLEQSEKSGMPFKRREPRKFTPTDRDEIVKINLFGSKPLGIFQTTEKYEESQPLKTWQFLHERELKLAVTHPPSNYFQEMILWTDQGKIWKFPIDNEQGMEEEKNIYFAEHVFLEKHLEPWCPPKGPIRHYMELVCVGLSKNPYMSVKHKKEHIEWYKEYFTDKEKLLAEIGALPQGFSMSPNKKTVSKK